LEDYRLDYQSNAPTQLSENNPVLLAAHVALAVDDLAAAQEFYGRVLGCEQGRSDGHWIDWNLYGHQFVTHQVEDFKVFHFFNEVDNHQVPVPHSGCILYWEQWEKLSIRLTANKTKFAVPPTIRFKGKVGEQATMICYDPAGNALEFKAFKNPNSLFES
jgi:uncharacterized protein